MNLIYYRPYLVYHENYDTNNSKLIHYNMYDICTSEVDANKLASNYAYMFKQRMCAKTKCKHIMRKVGNNYYVFRLSIPLKTVAYTTVDRVYKTAFDEGYVYADYAICKVGNSFIIRNPNNDYVTTVAIDMNEYAALNEALRIVDEHRIKISRNK